MDDAVRDLEADKAEFRKMIEQSSRPNVRRELLRALDKVEADIRQVLVKGAALASDEASAAAPAAPAGGPPDLDDAGGGKAMPAGSGALAKKEERRPAAEEEGRKPVAIDHRAAGPWTEITTFALDLGGHDKPLVSVDVRLKGVEALPPESVTCDFTESSFDLKVMGLDGKNLRMLKSALEKDIVPAESSVRVKKNHVVVSLQKVKGAYGYDSWTDLTAKGGKRRTTASRYKESPQDGIMDMMKDLYDDGDDGMKKIIGEAMYKARRGEKYEPNIGADGIHD